MKKAKATVKKLGTFSGGSYGLGRPGELINLWIVDCEKSREAGNSHVVGAIRPWVYPSREKARIAYSQ